MKNTKNMLLTGVVLASVLFSSIQLSAMEPQKKVNPHLHNYQKEFIESEIDLSKLSIKTDYWFLKRHPLDPNSDLYKKISQKIEQNKQRIKCFENLYYGNQAFTHKEYIEYRENCTSKN